MLEEAAAPREVIEGAQEENPGPPVINPGPVGPLAIEGPIGPLGPPAPVGEPEGHPAAENLGSPPRNAGPVAPVEAPEAPLRAGGPPDPLWVRGQTLREKKDRVPLRYRD